MYTPELGYLPHCRARWNRPVCLNPDRFLHTASHQHQRRCSTYLHFLAIGGSGAQKPNATDDHHMLMAMCAPRALYDTGNTDYTWLGNPACYVCGQACAKIYHQFGLDDRYGFNVDGGHGHCSFPADQESDVQYFLNKFMLGQTNLSQIIRTAPSSYTNIDYSQWTTWWGTTNPVLGP